jgi:hypothetical protein
LHSSRARKSVSATSSVEGSRQKPEKQTAETNYSTSSIREHSEEPSRSPENQPPKRSTNSKNEEFHATPTTHHSTKPAETNLSK